MWASIIGGLVGVASSWVKGKQQITQAKAEAHATVLLKSTADVAEWESLQAKASATSWKDEYLTLVFSIPAIVEYFQHGMEGLSNMPTWYQGLLAIMFAASFGIRKAVSIFGRHV